MRAICDFATHWYSVVQDAIRNPETKFYNQNISDAVSGLLSHVQDTINRSSGDCSETEDPMTTEDPESLNGTASCLIPNQQMVLQSLLSDLNNFSSCIHSREVDCAFDDHFQDIIILKDLLSNWNAIHVGLYYGWNIYIYLFAPGLLNISESWWDNDNRVQYELLSNSIDVVDFLKNALPPTDTEFRKLDTVSD